MTPVEAIIDALKTQADRHEARANSSWSYLHEATPGQQAEDAADRKVAEALRGVAEEFALALGVEA